MNKDESLSMDVNQVMVNLKAMGKHGIAAVRFKGVKSIEEAVDAKVVDMTGQAKNLGVKKGMGIKEALQMMM